MQGGSDCHGSCYGTDAPYDAPGSVGLMSRGSWESPGFHTTYGIQAGALGNDLSLRPQEPEDCAEKRCLINSESRQKSAGIVKQNCSGVAQIKCRLSLGYCVDYPSATMRNRTLCQTTLKATRFDSGTMEQTYRRS